MQERKIGCYECGTEKTDIVRGCHRFTESGLSNVTVEGIELVQCAACGAITPIIPRIVTIHRLLALAIARKPQRMTGGELPYLRKYAELTADGLGRLLHVPDVLPQTFERIGRDEPDLGISIDVEEMNYACA